MTADNDEKKAQVRRLQGRYMRMQRAQWVLTEPPVTDGASYSTAEPVYPDDPLRAAIEAFRRRRLTRWAAGLRELGVGLPGPTEDELEEEYDLLTSATLCIAAKSDAPDALMHVPHMAADYLYGADDHQWVTDMLEAFREQRLLEIEEESPDFPKRKELQEQLDQINGWRLSLNVALEQLEEMAKRVAANRDDD
jgi:hypothetical protein